ncbi:hypothetical protein NC651_024944 [Populus alba x Populus x berolinensis]|nr:hypothetical protein NC651_024944 [Populus alba x Populus x berolinensis]
MRVLTAASEHLLDHPHPSVIKLASCFATFICGDCLQLENQPPVFSGATPLGCTGCRMKLRLDKSILLKTGNELNRLWKGPLISQDGDTSLTITDSHYDLQYTPQTCCRHNIDLALAVARGTKKSTRPQR